MKKGAIKFLAGATIGTGLTIAASKFFASEQGKQAKEKIMEKHAEFFKFIAPKIKQLKEMTHMEYNDFIQRAAVEFGKINKISEKETEKLVKETQKLWNKFLKEMED